MRAKHGIATGELLDIPEVSHPGMLVMVNRLAIGAVQVTVLNFTGEKISGTVQSPEIPVGGRAIDLTSRRRIATVDQLGGFPVNLPPYGGMALLIKEPADQNG